MIPKVKQPRRTIGKLDFLEIKNFSALKDTVGARRGMASKQGGRRLVASAGSRAGAESRGRRGRFLPLAGRAGGRRQRGLWGVAAQPGGWDRRPGPGPRLGSWCSGWASLPSRSSCTCWPCRCSPCCWPCVWTAWLPASPGGTCSCPSSPLTGSAPSSPLSSPCTSSQDREKRLAVLRLFWVLTVLSLKFVLEMLLCQKLVEQTRSSGSA